MPQKESLADTNEAAVAAAPAAPPRASLHDFPEWAGALARAARRPERHATDPAYYSDERCLRITDAHPKARLHVLVVARDPRLGGPLDLTSQDGTLLEHMLEVAAEWAALHGGLSHFFCGFHAVPTFSQLHMHVVSKDLHSSWTERRHGLLSFAPPFFVHAQLVLRHLQQQGQLRYSLEAMDARRKGPLRCHWCGWEAQEVLLFREHVSACPVPET